MSEQQAPYLTLGRHLKYVREQSEETLAETSGAVEIDEASLERIEAGQERPSEDILLLLISHFQVQEQEALQLWELANYDREAPDQIKPVEAHINGKQMVMLLAMDLRTVYSDGVQIDANPAGITMNFTQAAGNNQANPVARVGMSLDQAEAVLQTLQTAILQTRYHRSPKQLPPPDAKR